MYFVRIVTTARNITEQAFWCFVGYCNLGISSTLKKVSNVSRYVPLAANYFHISVYIKWISAFHTNRTLKMILTFWSRNYFLILAHPVYKMWIIQEQNTLELWNKLHFEEEKKESI